MSQVWPASLPQNPLPGYEESAEPNTVRTRVGSGPDKVRLRSTLERVNQTTPMEMTSTQKATFEAFWATISNGADAFEWKDMDTGVTVDFRFRRKPKFKNLTPAPIGTDRVYSCVLGLERL